MTKQYHRLFRSNYRISSGSFFVIISGEDSRESFDHVPVDSCRLDPSLTLLVLHIINLVAEKRSSGMQREKGMVSYSLACYSKYKSNTNTVIMLVGS